MQLFYLDSCVRCGVVASRRERRAQPQVARLASRTDDCAREDPNDCHGIVYVALPDRVYRAASNRTPQGSQHQVARQPARCPLGVSHEYHVTALPQRASTHPTLASASLPSRSSTNPAGRARQGIPELRQLGSGALHDPSRWCSRTPYPGHLSNLHPPHASIHPSREEPIQVRPAVSTRATRPRRLRVARRRVAASTASWGWLLLRPTRPPPVAPCLRP